MSSNCLVFHTSGGISSSPAAFLTRVPTEEKCFNIGQYVFKSYEFKMLNFTKCYALFLFVK